MDKVVTILGAGLAGLSTAYSLAKAGIRVRVIEKEPYVGGLAASFKSGEFTYDLGPHRFHSQNEAIMDHVMELLGENYDYRERLSRIFMRDQFFNYPLKASNVLRNLPVSFLVKAFADYFGIRVYNFFKPIPDDCFENWTKKRFGNTLYKMFFGTYTEKAWGLPCTEISADWAAQRITLLNLWDTVKKTLFKPKNVPRTYVSKFIYPKDGGIGAICERYAEEVRERGGEVFLGAEIKGIEIKGTRAEKIIFNVGEKQHSMELDRLISTIPCTVLLDYLNPAAPDPVRKANANLKHIGIVFVLFDMATERVTRDHWIYLPSHDLTVHRISEFKNFSERTCPADRTMICAEITCRVGDGIWTSDHESLKATAVRDLGRLELIRPEDVGRVRIHRAPHAYPLYDLTYKANLDTLMAFLDSFDNLKTAGRQGLFKYNNMDHSIEMGLELAQSIISGEARDHKLIASEKKYFG
ncbi:MAG: FAD-dependent oxidoreductase [Planctomycetota bacterium]|jgi:protoporphyrinogen oxidase